MYFPSHLPHKFQIKVLPQTVPGLTRARAEFGPSFPHRGTKPILEDPAKKLECYIKCADLYYPTACTRQIYLFFPIRLVLEGKGGRSGNQHSFKCTEPASGLLSSSGDLYLISQGNRN